MTKHSANVDSPVVRFVSRYFVGQEANGDPLIDQVLWEQVGDAEPVAVMVRGQVTSDEWTAATAEQGEACKECETPGRNCPLHEIVDRT